jgi:hypothetical protein
MYMLLPGFMCLFTPIPLSHEMQFSKWFKMAWLLAVLTSSTLILRTCWTLYASVFSMQCVWWNNLCSYFAEDVVAATNHKSTFPCNICITWQWSEHMVSVTVCHCAFSRLCGPSTAVVSCTHLQVSLPLETLQNTALCPIDSTILCQLSAWGYQFFLSPTLHARARAHTHTSASPTAT